MSWGFQVTNKGITATETLWATSVWALELIREGNKILPGAEARGIRVVFRKPRFSRSIGGIDTTQVSKQHIYSWKALDSKQMCERKHTQQAESKIVVAAQMREERLKIVLWPMKLACWNYQMLVGPKQGAQLILEQIDRC